MKTAALLAIAVSLTCAGAGFAIANRTGLSHSSLARSVPAHPLSGRIILDPQQRREAMALGHLNRPVSTILKLDSPMKHGQYRWDDSGVPNGPVWIHINVREQLMSVFRGPNEIGTAVILYGANSKETPLGTFPILAKLREHRSSTYGNAPMPYTLRLTRDGVSIHGSKVRDGYATHGCIGVPEDFAAKLFEIASKGDEVTIVST